MSLQPFGFLIMLSLLIIASADDDNSPDIGLNLSAPPGPEAPAQSPAPDASQPDGSAFNALDTILNSVVQNGDFSAGLTSWSWPSQHDGVYSASGGVATMTRTEVGDAVHLFQSPPVTVSCGDKISMVARVRSGPLYSSQYNTGCGPGFDLRENSLDYSMIGTYNGAATDSDQWTIIYSEFVIPRYNKADGVASGEWFVIDDSTGQALMSTTAGGARFGRSGGLADFYKLNPYPDQMRIAVWAQNWQRSMSFCQYDYVHFQITPGACS
jgi:hypothetical protein